MEEAIEPGDATPLTGPSRKDSIPRAPSPTTITIPSPPRPPPPPPQDLQSSDTQNQNLNQLNQNRHNHQHHQIQIQTQSSQTQTEKSLAREASQTKENTQPQQVNMGTVLSFSPRERRGSIYPPSQHPADFTLNNFNYEQLNNVKNRENKSCVGTIQSLPPTNHPPTNNNSLQNNNINLNNNDNAKIISEKNALEKNLKKHSLFINALSWKRFSTSNNNKKKLDNKNKNITFRQPLDNIPIVDKNKNIQTPQVSLALRRFESFFNDHTRGSRQVLPRL